MSDDIRLFTERDIEETRNEAAFWAADPSGRGRALSDYYRDLSARIAAAMNAFQPQLSPPDES